MPPDARLELQQARVRMLELQRLSADQAIATAKAQEQAMRASQDLAEAEEVKKVQGNAIDAYLGELVTRGSAMSFTKKAGMRRTAADAKRKPDRQAALDAATAGAAVRQADSEAQLAESKARAATLFHSGNYVEAAMLYTTLIDSSRAELNDV